MRVALYTRVSTDDQAREGTSLEVQSEYLIAYAKRNNHDIFDIYVDDGYSGGSIERPAMSRLRADAKKSKFTLVLVYKIDRFCRDNFLFHSILKELYDVGVGFKSATEDFDTSTAAGNMTINMLGAFAQFERERLKERIFPGMIKGAQRGNWQGARYTPYGYSYNKLDPEKKLRVVKEEAEIVKMIYAMYLSGQSTQQIAGYLYKKGYKTRSGGKFNTKLVCDILKSQVYLGHLVWNTHHYDKKQKTLKGCKYIKNDPSKVVIYKGRHESIISQEDFDAVQKRLEQARKGVVRKCNSNEYPLTWLLICPRCGNRFQGCVNTATRENKITKTKRRYYRCAARQTYDINCDNSYARAEELEAEVYSIIDVMFEGDIDEARMLNLIRNSSEPHSEGIEKDLSDKKSELAKNIRQQEKLSKIYREELLAIEAYKTQIIPLRDEEKDLKAKIKKLELSLVERERSKEYLRMIQDVVRHFDTINEKMDLISKKGLLKIIFKSIKVDNGQISDFELYEPYKSLYEGARIEWQLSENQRVAMEEASVSTLLPSAGRMRRYYRPILQFLAGLYNKD